MGWDVRGGYAQSWRTHISCENHVVQILFFLFGGKPFIIGCIFSMGNMVPVTKTDNDRDYQPVLIPLFSSSARS